MITPSPGIRDIAGFDISRYNELSDSKPIISYYILVSSLNKCMAARKDGKLSAPEDKTTLITMMDQCEKLKSKYSLTKDRDLGDVEAFVIGVFITAEQEDKAGNPTKQTAIKYRCAAYFFELLQELGISEYEDKLKFSRFRAAQIANACRNGVPIPPHPFLENVTKEETSATQIPNSQQTGNSKAVEDSPIQVNIVSETDLEAEDFDLPDPCSNVPGSKLNDSDLSDYEEEPEYITDTAVMKQVQELIKSADVALNFKDAKPAATILLQA